MEVVHSLYYIVYDFLVTVKVIPHECVIRTGLPETKVKTENEAWFYSKVTTEQPGGGLVQTTTKRNTGRNECCICSKYVTQHTFGENKKYVHD